MSKSTNIRSTKSNLDKLISLDEKIKSIHAEQEKIKHDLNSFLTNFLIEKGALQLDFVTLLGALDHTLKTLKHDPSSHEKFLENGKKILKK
jgi:regulator of replication initiation timing